jgi:nitrite reductase/ring-hydroxylating ferredoxin subunit
MCLQEARIRYTRDVTTYHTVGPLERFPESKVRRVFVDGREIGVVQYDGRFYAFSNRCTHNDFQMHFGFIEDGCLWCPIHYGQFDLATGRAMGGPVTDLASFEVRVVDDEVQVGVPETDGDGEAAKSEPAGEAG